MVLSILWALLVLSPAAVFACRLHNGTEKCTCLLLPECGAHLSVACRRHKQAVTKPKQPSASVQQTQMMTLGQTVKMNFMTGQAHPARRQPQQQVAVRRQRGQARGSRNSRWSQWSLCMRRGESTGTARMALVSFLPLYVCAVCTMPCAGVLRWSILSHCSNMRLLVDAH